MNVIVNMIEVGIKKCGCQIKMSDSQGLYPRVKEAWGGEVYFKSGPSREDIKWVISYIGNFMLLGGRNRFFRKG